jgi:N-acetylmuramic acid 6-phosphate (MurNAc-6-P) etherase
MRVRVDEAGDHGLAFGIERAFSGVARFDSVAWTHIDDAVALDRDGAVDLLDRSGQQVKLALMMHLGQLEATAAAACLAQHDGHLARALAAIRRVQP